MKLEKDTTISHYKILSKIGKGGMGEVYLAEDTKLDRRVALKILPAEFAEDKDRMSRFVREAKSASALNHPNIITIYEINEIKNIHFIAMEFIDGKTLNEYAKDNPLTLESALEIAIQTVSALDVAHVEGIVHRDIKPDNVMIRPDGLVKILDFGIAKLTEERRRDAEVLKAGEDDETLIARSVRPSVPASQQTKPGMIIGTANYMSPEQARGQQVDQQTDIFSFGVVLYELLSGKSPFAGGTFSDMIAAVLMKEPKPLENIPPKLSAIVKTTLQKDKKRRYQTAQGLLEDLKEFKRGFEIKSNLQSPVERDSSPNFEDEQTQLMPTSATEDLRPDSIIDSEEGFRVAVVPFRYPASSTDLESLSEGLSEEIVTGLSRFSYLRVISQSTRETANGGESKRAGHKRGAQYLIEGSIHQSGPVIRISIQLVDADSGHHLWAETYNRPFQPENIFSLHDELVPIIVSTIADMHGILPHSISESLRKQDPNGLTPYESVLRSFGYIERITETEHAEVRDILERAAATEPGNADCMAMLSYIYAEEYKHGFNLKPDPLGRALEAARQAVSAAPSNHLARHMLAQAHFFRREISSFKINAEKAVALNPMDGDTIAFMGILLSYAGDWERGCTLAERAMQLNPHHPGWYRFAAFNDAFRKADYVRARNVALEFNMPSYFYTHIALAAVNGHIGNKNAARKALDELLELKSDFEISGIDEMRKWFIDPELFDKYTQGLHKAGLEFAPAPGLSEARNTQTRPTSTMDDEFSQSIAVLPFTNISADEENEYFCDGLAEELLNALSKIEDLKVAARTSAFSFKGKNSNVSEIGVKLSVKNVLEGSVRKSGNKLRITVQLINASDGYQLWSERYDREMEDIFDIQDEIALAVADALKLQLFGDEKAAVLKRGTNNPEAYQLYLKGRFYFEKFTVEGYEKSVDYFEKALAIEPNYAPAFAALSKSHNFAWYLGFGETAECISEAKAAVDKALALDQTLAEAQHSLALIKFNYERDWISAEKAFRRAIELNYTENHEHYCMFLAVLERSDEAVAEAELAIKLAPIALVPNYIAGWGFWLAGRVDLANEQGEKLLEMEPNFSGGHILRGMSLWNKGSYQLAIDKLETAVKLGGGNDIKMLLGLMYGIEGERAKAKHFLTDFERLEERGIFTAIQRAFIYAGSGEMDRAFKLLEKASERHEGSLPFLKQFSSIYPEFHNDPRMTDLLKRLNLPE